VYTMQTLGIEGGFIDARGDMRIYGPYAERISVQHPRDRRLDMVPVVLHNKAIATSGDYKQYDTSFDKSHIIGQKDLASVSVIAETTMDADAIATCLFVLGTKHAGIFLRTQSVPALLIDTSMTVHRYNGYGEVHNGR
jgi:thiamine biosynthesis lipoprotein